MSDGIRVVGGVALLAAGLLALPADLTSQPLAVDLPDSVAASVVDGPVVSQPQAAVGEAIPEAVIAGEDDYVIEDTQFGIRLFDPSIEKVGDADTLADVVAYPGVAPRSTGLSPVDATVQTFDSSPLPIPEGAELVESQFDGWQWVAVSIDAQRSLADVEAFYAGSFDPSLTITRTATDGAVTLDITLDGRMLGWVGIVEDGDVVRARVTWNG